MLFLKILFWAGLFIIFYSYLGYGMLLWLITSIRKLFTSPATLPPATDELPVTIVIAAFNEEDFITEKIHNTLALDYPSDKRSIIFITDGSTDNTFSLASSFPEITVLHQPERKGKIAAIHRAMSYVNTPVVIFSDANTLLNESCVRNIVRHYQHPQTGGVAGEKKVIISSDGNNEGAGEGLYWKYESFLKKLDAELYTVVGAAGELFSIRTELYEPVGNDVILDDFIISLRICQKGYRIAYAPDAFATEAPSASLAEEQKRKIRISAGAFQSIVMLKGLLNIFKTPLLSFQYISHRLLRWTLCPPLLMLVLLLNIPLAIYENGNWYKAILACQLLFYMAALAGWILSKNNIKISLLYVPYYFVFQNISLYQGFVKFINGTQTVLWDKAVRGSYTKP